MNLRIGHGYDAHRFGEGNQVALAGMNVPASVGVIAHSDGDVILHALCDAILGACGLGDIGQHFPDTDASLRGISSLILLEKTLVNMRALGWELINIDVTLLAEIPRIAKLRMQMRETLAQALNLTVDAVNIKATTTEGMGWIGRREGLAAHAVVLLRK